MASTAIGLDADTSSSDYTSYMWATATYLPNRSRWSNVPPLKSNAFRTNEPVVGLGVSHELLRVLGTNPAIGRVFALEISAPNRQEICIMAPSFEVAAMDAYLISEETKKLIRLGKPVRSKDDESRVLTCSQNPYVHNHEDNLLNEVLWAFLADYAHEELRVVFSDEFVHDRYEYVTSNV